MKVLPVSDTRDFEAVDSKKALFSLLKCDCKVLQVDVARRLSYRHVHVPYIDFLWDNWCKPKRTARLGFGWRRAANYGHHIFKFDKFDQVEKIFLRQTQQIVANREAP